MIKSERSLREAERQFLRWKRSLVRLDLLPQITDYCAYSITGNVKPKASPKGGTRAGLPCSRKKASAGTPELSLKWCRSAQRMTCERSVDEPGEDSQQGAPVLRLQTLTGTLTHADATSLP